MSRTTAPVITTLLSLGALVAVPPVAHTASTATINGAQIHQPIDGFGFSEAFGRGAIMHGSEGLSAGRQREVLDLLLSPTTGAGLSILRLHIGSTANGDSYRVSKRLWALASYSRFVRPDATRVGATTGDGNLRLSAFQNTDGSLTVVALNAAGSATSVSYALSNTGITTGTATPYLTNNGNSMTAQSPVSVNGGAFTATVPAPSLVTYRITATD